MNIDWLTNYNEVGNALGYSFYNRKMKEQAEKYFQIVKDADTTVTVYPADNFVKTPGKYNFLLTMFESFQIPESFIKGINEADEIITPSRFCKDVFRQYTKKPISVCHAGVDGNVFKFKERSYIGRPVDGPFRILWVGATSGRKGWPIMSEMVKIFENHPQFEIYLKTTVPKNEYSNEKIDKEAFKDKFPKYANDEVVLDRIDKINEKGPDDSLHNKLFRKGVHQNIVWDSRVLPIDELVELYQSAHLFVFPSFGEGWGLTLAEAMSTGAPCIATNCTGQSEFFDESVGYEIKWKLGECNFIGYEKFRGQICVPDTNDTVNRIMEAYNDYGRAVRKGVRAAERMRTKFTWEQAGKRFQEILRGYENRIQRAA